MGWPCFLIDKTDTARETLRRYASNAGTCTARPGWDYHGAEVEIAASVPFFSERGYNGSGVDDFPHGDPRWPTACACGYVFTDTDNWQHNLNRLYSAPDGQTFVLSEAPIGAMWDAAWFDDHWHGDDGRCLVVKLPDRSEWMIDGPAANSDTGWQRTGEPPRITATPSIASGKYHGWLRDGVLTDDIEGRTY